MTIMLEGRDNNAALHIALDVSWKEEKGSPRKVGKMV